MVKHILLPTDGSELSGRAVRAGLELARALNARLTALHVMPEYQGDDVRDLASLVEQGEFEATCRETAARYLSAVAAIAKAIGVPRATQCVAADSPSKAIVGIAAERECDCIFMAPYGNRSATGFLLGSNTNRVLIGARVTVIVHR